MRTVTETSLTTTRTTKSRGGPLEAQDTAPSHGGRRRARKLKAHHCASAMMRVAVLAILSTASAAPQARPALLLAGDSRDRGLFQLVAPALCGRANLHWTAPAPFNPTVADGVACHDSSEFSSMAFHSTL